MPHITISMYPGRTDEIKKKMAANIKASFVESTGMPDTAVSVSIEEIVPNEFPEEMEKRFSETNVLYESSDYVKQ